MSKTQACQGHTMLQPSSIPSARGPPWWGQMFDVAKNLPSTLYRATSCPLSSTFTAVPGVTCSMLPAFTQVFAIARSIERSLGGVKKQGRAVPLFLHPPEFVHPAGFVPVFDIQIALRIPAGPVGGGELSVLPVFRRDVEVAALLRVRVLAEMGNQLVVLVQDRNAPLQIGDDEVAAEHIDRARVAHAFGGLADELAVQTEDLDPVIRAVRDDQERRPSAEVEADPVGGRQLPLLAFAAVPRPDILAFGGPLVAPALPIAVADVDVASGTDGHAGRLVFALALVHARHLGVRNGQQDFAVEGAFDHFTAPEVAEPQHFLAAFGRDLHAVGSALELLAPGLHESPVRLEDHHRVLGVGVEEHAVLGVHLDVAMGAAHVLHALGQLRPPLETFVLVDPVAQDDFRLLDALGEDPLG